MLIGYRLVRFYVPSSYIGRALRELIDHRRKELIREADGDAYYTDEQVLRDLLDDKHTDLFERYIEENNGR